MKDKSPNKIILYADEHSPEGAEAIKEDVAWGLYGKN